MSKINHSSYMPLYAQIIDYLTEMIDSGRYKTGEQIPSEMILAKDLGVSRITVTNAIQRMVQEGTLYRIQGKGTFVAEKKSVEHRLTTLISFTEDMVSRGYQTRTELVSIELVVPSEKIMQNLELSEGDQTWKIKRIRYADEEPMAIQNAYLPEKIFPDLDKKGLGNNSLYDLLRDGYKVEMSEAEEHYRVMVLRKEEEARMLNVTPEFPALFSVRVSTLKNKQKFEYTESILRGDRYVLSVKLSI